MQIRSRLWVWVLLLLSLGGCGTTPHRDAVQDTDRVASPEPLSPPAPVVIVQKPAQPAKAPPAPQVLNAPDAPQPAPLPADQGPLLGAPPAEGLPSKTSFRVWALDIGQGSATLLEYPCGAMLVDTGGELNKLFDSRIALENALDTFFARRPDLRRTFDLVVLTHPHIDHVRGLPLVLEKYRVKNVVDNGNPGDDLVASEMQALREYLAKHRRKVGHRSVRDGDFLSGQAVADGVIDPIACRPINPEIRVLSGGVEADPGWGESRYHSHFSNENNHSVVLRVDFGASSVLITGDLEEVAIDGLVRRYAGTGLLDADVYVVGHHGSHNGTTQALLDEVTPDVALISMGPDHRRRSWTAWKYGHPREPVVRLLESAVRARRDPVEVKVATSTRTFFSTPMHRAIFATGWDGTVVLDMSQDGQIFVRTGSLLTDAVPAAAAP